jgi:hypothetical protein
MSPREIMAGQRLDYVQQCRFEYGEYVQTHEQHNSSMTPRTIGALALWPTGNPQGTWYFMSLLTGRVLKRNHATQLPMPHEVIDTVHRMADDRRLIPGWYSLIETMCWMTPMTTLMMSCTRTVTATTMTGHNRLVRMKMITAITCHPTMATPIPPMMTQVIQ